MCCVLRVACVVRERERADAEIGGVAQRMETLYALLLVVQNQALRKHREAAVARPQL